MTNNRPSRAERRAASPDVQARAELHRAERERNERLAAERVARAARAAQSAALLKQSSSVAQAVHAAAK